MRHLIIVNGLSLQYFAFKAKTKKLCGSGNPTLPTILVPTLIFFRPVKKKLKNRRKSRYCSVQLAIRYGTVQ